MPAPDLTLAKYQIVVSQTDSALGIDLINSGFQFGLVEIVNSLSDRFVVGDTVLYDPQGATQFRYSGTDYFITTEDMIFFKENPAP